MYSGSVLQLLHSLWGCEVLAPESIQHFILSLCPLRKVEWNGRLMDNASYDDFYTVLCDRGTYETVTEEEEKVINPLEWDNTKFLWMLKACWIHMYELSKMTFNDKCGADLAQGFTADTHLLCSNTLFSTKVFCSLIQRVSYPFSMPAVLRLICPLPPCESLVFAACLRKCLGRAWYTKLTQRTESARSKQLASFRGGIENLGAELVMKGEMILPLYQKPEWYGMRMEEAHSNFSHYKPSVEEILPLHATVATHMWMDRMCLNGVIKYLGKLKRWMQTLMSIQDPAMRNFFVEVTNCISDVYDRHFGTYIYSTCMSFCKMNILKTIYRLYMAQKFKVVQTVEGVFEVFVTQEGEPMEENEAVLPFLETQPPKPLAMGPYREHYALNPLLAWAVFDKVLLLPDIKTDHTQMLFK